MDINPRNESHQHTQSLCPICLARIDATRVLRGGSVFLQKTCEAHGVFTTPVWVGGPSFVDWRSPQKPPLGLVENREKRLGCPFDCGICREHRQHACNVLLEITQRCNLDCPVCFADAGKATTVDPSTAIISGWLEKVSALYTRPVVQLSGGEPTMRNDLPEIIARGKTEGVEFIQLNTNGIRLAQEPGFAKSLADAGLSSVFLQFDGTRDDIYRKIRGRDLFEIKKTAVTACADAGLGVILVPTLKPGVNTDNIGSILRFALENISVLNGVHFQPMSYFGRYPGQPSDEDRLTLPQLMAAIEEQTLGLFTVSQFQPPGCEASWCSFHCNYLVPASGKPVVISENKENTACCSTPSGRNAAADKAVSLVKIQWGARDNKREESATPKAFCRDKQDSSKREAVDLDDFLSLAHTRSFSLSAMAFQDVWNLDLERVQECCIHVMAPDNRLIPFCMYNLTSADGRSLYRHG